MSSISSPLISSPDSSIYNSALGGELSSISITEDLSSFKTDENVSDDETLAEETFSSSNFNESKAVNTSLHQSRAKVNRSLFGSEEDDIKIYDTLEEFNNNLPDTVTLLTSDAGSQVYLVGTAHFSESSQNDVSLVIRNVKPDVVLVELCPSRVHILRHDKTTLLEEAKDITLSKVRSIVKTNGLINGVFYILLLNMSAKITKELGMAPGGEFRRAVSEVQKLQNCVVHLGDRPISVTLQRALHGLSLFQTLKLVWKLLFFDEKITVEDVEQCKQKDLLEQLMKEMAGEFPAFGNVFVNERDLYLCHSLQVAALPQDHINRAVRVVGVVGIGHCNGIKEKWGNVDPRTVAEILSIPPVSLSNRVFKFIIKYGMMGLTGYAVFKICKSRIKHIL